MAGADELSRDTDVDLTGIFASIWNNKFKLLVASLLITALAYVVLMFVEPRYESEARILIRASDSILSGPASGGAAQSTDFDDPGIASQVQLLQSRDIARRIIEDEELGLLRNPEFETGRSNSALADLLSLFGIGGGAKGLPEDRVLESYYDRLKVYQADRARVIVVSFWSQDQELAAKIPNRIAAEYVKLQEELKRGSSPEELAQLEPELENQRQLVLDAEAKVADYRAQSDILQGRDNDSLATQELSELATELGRVRTQLSQAEANADAVARALNSGNLDSASQVLASPLIQRLQERLGALESELADQSTTLLDGHPRIQRLNSQITTLERQISREAGKIQRSLEAQAEVARDREEDLVQRRNQLKSEAGRVDRANVDMRSLEREADAQRQLLNTYLLRFKEAKSRQKRQFLPADAYIFSKAQVPSTSYFPKKAPILGGTFFGTFLMGAMFCMAGAVLSGAAVAPSPRPVGGRVPEAHVVDSSPATLQPSMEALTQPVAPMVDNSVPVDLVAASIATLGASRVAVLTPSSEDGAAATVSLARALYAKGAPCVLIDAAGQGQASQLTLGRTDLPGLKNLLAGTAGFADCLHTDPTTGLHVLPTGTDVGAGNASRLSNVLTALQQTYGCVIIDCGPAKVSGLRAIFDEETVCVVNALQPGDAKAMATATDLQSHGFPAPLVMRRDADEAVLSA